MTTQIDRQGLAKQPHELSAKMRQLEAALNATKLIVNQQKQDLTVMEGIVNAVSDSVIFVDTVRRVRKVNSAFSALFECLPEAILGHTTEQLYESSASYEAQGQKHFDLRTESSIGIYEDRYRRQSGEVFLGQTVVTAVKDEQGQTLGYLGTIRDADDGKASPVEDRKRLESALQDNRTRYRSLYRKTPVMLHSVNSKRCLIDVSDYWLSKLGYERSEVIGRNLSDFLSTDSQRYAEEVVLPEYFKTGACSDIPYQIVTKTGDVIDVLLSASVERDAAGSFERSLAVMIDVTERNRALAALEASESRFRTFMDNSPNLTFVEEADTGRIVYVNQPFESFFQIEQADIIGRTDFDWLPFEAAQKDRHCDCEAVKAGKTLRLSESILDRQGVPHEWMVLKFPFQDANYNTLVGGIAINMDEQKRLERQLHQEKELAQVTLHSIGDAVITTDAQGLVTFLNPIAEKLTGWTETASQGRLLSEIFVILNEHTREPVESPVTQVLRKGAIVGLANHTVLIAKDGTELGIEDSAAPIRDHEGNLIGTVLVFHDVTKTRQLANRLSWQVSHDELTQLVNRRQFEQELIEVLRPRNKSAVLCYLDLDQFKLVNDHCGHAAGDQLLQQVTGILTQQVRESDTVARLGGDEFAILLRQCSLEFAHQIAVKVCEYIQGLRFVWEDRAFSVGASIGLVEITSDSHDATEVMATADAACYAAKAAGRNRVHVHHANDFNLSHRRAQQQWCLQIDRALEENRFQLYHQQISQIEEPDGAYYHTEILLRLLNEQGQIVAPMAFIPAAERYHRMPLIDQWVIRQCLTELSKAELQPTERAPQRIYNINLSGASLSDDQFLTDLKTSLQSSCVDPKILCFEITETVAISNLHNVAVFMNTLKHLGCRFALDDFGSGMSSFGYLRQLPVDYIKIDGSFIQNLDDPLSAAIVSSICHIGQSINIQIIAESVEDDTTRNQLKVLGVDYVQGYGVARPVPFSLSTD